MLDLLGKLTQIEGKMMTQSPIFFFFLESITRK